MSAIIGVGGFMLRATVVNPLVHLIKKDIYKQKKMAIEQWNDTLVRVREQEENLIEENNMRWHENW